MSTTMIDHVSVPAGSSAQAPAAGPGATRDPHTGHVYDGIQEYDNPTPGWWWLIFVVSIVYAAVYFFIYNVDPYAPTVYTALEDERTAANKKLFAREGDLNPDEPTILRYMHDEAKRDFLAVGASIFRANCVSCHGGSGEGVIGPNLTDDAYKNVKTLVDISSVISAGAAQGAMPAWGGRLSKPEIVLVSAYVGSLRGKNLPGRVSEGTVAPPFPAYTKADPARSSAPAK